MLHLGDIAIVFSNDTQQRRRHRSSYYKHTNVCNCAYSYRTKKTTTTCVFILLHRRSPFRTCAYMHRHPIAPHPFRDWNKYNVFECDEPVSQPVSHRHSAKETHYSSSWLCRIETCVCVVRILNVINHLRAFRVVVMMVFFPVLFFILGSTYFFVDASLCAFLRMHIEFKDYVTNE